LFDGEDHPPYVNNSQKDEGYDIKRARLVEREHPEPKSINKDAIEEKFRTGKGHGANPIPLQPSIVKDPYDKATECYKKYLLLKERK